MYDREKMDQLRKAMEKWDQSSLQRTLERLPERQY
jgi:hypothetical protein